MAKDSQLTKWANIAKIAAAVIAFATLLLGGGFVYNEFWNVPDLRYFVLPTYNMEEVAMSGLIVENRGRVPARDVEIVIAELEHPIERLYMPGPEGKTAKTTWKPDNPTNAATIEKERLSPGSSLLIYLRTGNPVTLDEGKTFIISSDRGRATSAFNDTEWQLIRFTIESCLGFIGLVFGMVLAFWVGWRGGRARERQYLRNPKEPPNLMELLEEMYILERTGDLHS